MENDPVEGGARVRADATTFIRGTVASLLRPADADLVSEWAATLLANGYASSSVDRAAKRLRAFARSTPNGLLRAAKSDVYAFYRKQEALLLQRQAAGEAAGLEPVHMAYFRHPTWTQFESCARQFYLWAERRGLIPRALNPVRGLRHYPPVRTGISVQPRWYCRLLHDPSLDRREAALLWLLGHGLTPAEVLRLTPGDVDLEAQEVQIRGPRCVRVVPLSEAGVARFAPWVRGKRWQGRRWLFPSRRGRAISDRTLRDIVHKVVERVFPGPSYVNLRSTLHPGGFRHAFIVLALRRRIPVDCLLELTGLRRAKLLTAYLSQTAPPEKLREEFRRITGRGREWL
jgi:site-specific recombinase XerD